MLGDDADGENSDIIPDDMEADRLCVRRFGGRELGVG